MFIKVLLILLILILLVEQYCRWNEKTMAEMLHPDWYEDPTKFPYHNFPCKKNHSLYLQTIGRGYNRMNKTRVVIAGLCMNIEKQVPKLRKRVEYMGSFFQDYKCIIFENDSKDRTRDLLKEIASENPNFILMDCPEAEDCKLKRKGAKESGAMSSNRMKMMAEYRNRIVNYITQTYGDYDCVMFLDLDLEGPIDMNGLAHSFGIYESWDSISAFGLTGVTLTMGSLVYYDYLAYDDGKHRLNDNLSNILPIIFKTNKKEVGDDPFPVRSGFCGLALYKMEIFTDRRGINYTPKDGKYECEHIILHKNMIENGYDRIFINPNMILLAGVQGPYDKYPIY